MKAASLLLIFVLAKILVLWGRQVPWWSWTVIGYVWQDVLVALVLAAIAWCALRTRPRLTSLVYWTLAVYTALNVPVAVILSTPLTWRMLRAARGTLADSILLYATWRNALLVLLTLGAAAMLPRVLERTPVPLRRLSVAAALLVVAIGPAAAARVDTIGLHRNVVVALVASGLPQVEADAADADWTNPPFGGAHDPDDLSDLRGIAAGRNVVLVSLESTAAQYLRLYGAAEHATPHLDGLARQAVVFEHAYAAYPESIKGLYSILCSTFPAFDIPQGTYAQAPCPSIAAVLASEGYRTGLFHSGRFAYLGMRSVIDHRGFHTLEDAGDIGGNHQSSFGVDEPSTVARMLAWIDALPAGQPFFMTYLPIAGHHPYDTPEAGPFPDREEIGRYRNALHYGDQALGALIAGLQARGIDRRTLWIVLGDHGEAFGQHEGNYGHSFFLYDENVRVPFFVSVPGILHGEQRSRTIASLVDTAPTILDVLGLPSPPGYQGRSLLDGRPRMALFFTDYSLGLLGLRDGRWKFIHELQSRRSKLFDLDRDPGETVDVASGQPERAAAYQDILRAWSAAQKSYLQSWTRSGGRAAVPGPESSGRVPAAHPDDRR